MQRFLKPHQKDVTKMLLYTAQASHPLVPPEVPLLIGQFILSPLHLLFLCQCPQYISSCIHNGVSYGNGLKFVLLICVIISNINLHLFSQYMYI